MKNVFKDDIEDLIFLQFFVKNIKEGKRVPAAPVKGILPKVETQSQHQKFKALRVPQQLN